MSSFRGRGQVTIQGLQVTRIECLAGPSTLAYCEFGVYDWELTFDGDGHPDSVFIDLEYPEHFLFGNSFITRGVFTEFEFNKNYTSSTYRYYDNAYHRRRDFAITASDQLYTSFIPHQTPYLNILPAPGTGIVKAEGPAFILEAAGYKILRKNKHLISSINDTEFDYVLNSDGQVVEMTMNSTGREKTFLFTYHE